MISYNLLHVHTYVTFLRVLRRCSPHSTATEKVRTSSFSPLFFALTRTVVVYSLFCLRTERFERRWTISNASKVFCFSSNLARNCFTSTRYCLLSMDEPGEFPTPRSAPDGSASHLGIRARLFRKRGASRRSCAQAPASWDRENA